MNAEEFFHHKFGNKITASDSWVIRFAEEYASQFTPSPKEISEEEIDEVISNEWIRLYDAVKPGELFPATCPDWVRNLIRTRFASLSLPSSGSKTEEVELPEDIQDFIDGIERIKAQVKNGKYSYAEKTKQELINKLNDIV